MSPLLLLLLALLPAPVARAQTPTASPGGCLLSLIAGSPTGAAGLADGAGTSALFSIPNSVAVDGNGTAYVTDQSATKVRRLLPNGTVNTFATLATGTLAGSLTRFGGQPLLITTGTYTLGGQQVWGTWLSIRVGEGGRAAAVDNSQRAGEPGAPQLGLALKALHLRKDRALRHLVYGWLYAASAAGGGEKATCTCTYLLVVKRKNQKNSLLMASLHSELADIGVAATPEAAAAARASHAAYIKAWRGAE